MHYIFHVCLCYTLSRLVYIISKKMQSRHICHQFQISSLNAHYLKPITALHAMWLTTLYTLFISYHLMTPATFSIATLTLNNHHHPTRVSDNRFPFQTSATTAVPPHWTTDRAVWIKRPTPQRPKFIRVDHSFSAHIDRYSLHRTQVLITSEYISNIVKFKKLV